MASRWPVVAPLAAIAVVGAAFLLPLGALLVWLAVPALVAAVVAAVHHAEVVAHRVGEPFGTLILALAVTVIEVAPSSRKVCSRWRMAPATTHSPTAPLAMIMIAAKIVSRGSAAASAPPASIIERMSATAITVTASARMSVPNGSPTR